MKWKIKNILSFFFALTLTRCANVVTPTGGPKDLTPPRVTEARPANHSTGFSGRRIEIDFDEYITLENALQNVLFSPPLANKPDIKLSNKTVVIRFKEDLRPNTTYTIQFGSAVKDFHEGNLFKDYVYTFSTGEQLDTLSVSGKVLNADDMKPAEDFWVGLYHHGSDSLFEQPLRRAPDYLAKTDKEGRFSLHGLPDESFLVFALKDMNANLYYDMPNESIAFIDTLIDSKSSVELFAFTETDTSQMLLENKLVENGLLRFVFRQPADGLMLDLPDRLADSFRWAPVWSPSHDTLWCYFTPGIMDSLRVRITDGKGINDSTRYSLKHRESAQGGKRGSQSLTIKNNLKNNLLLPDQDLTLTCSEPILDDTIRFGDRVLAKADEYGLSFRLCETVPDTSKFQLNVPDSVFFSVRGRTNDSISLSFRKAKKEDLGNIFITVQPPGETPVVLQLLDAKEKVVEQRVLQTEERVAFGQLPPDRYRLQAILDTDGDGKWSTGNFHKCHLPETKLQYKDVLEVKSGWDIDLEEKWILFSK